MKFTTEQFRALLNACDTRLSVTADLVDAGSRVAAREADVLHDLAHSFACMLSMIAESEADDRQAA